MKDLIADILSFAHEHDRLSSHDLDRIIQDHNRQAAGAHRRYAKKMIWPAYCKVRESSAGFPEEWQVTQRTEQLLAQACQMKPRRTASGVATVTVLTRPHACRGNCLFCPSDVRMPKSYLHDEPACQRAERNYFDPYLQVASRLRALQAMGHACDKVELIVLGGTFDDYSEDYRRWFVHELFRALNEAFGPQAQQSAHQRRDAYRKLGISNDAQELQQQSAAIQQQLDKQDITYAQAVHLLYGPTSPWQQVDTWQQASWQQLEDQQHANEQSQARCVGLVVETRPEAIDAASLTFLRHLGCTKVQVGIQSLDETSLATCQRPTHTKQVVQAFELLRVFGFKSHVHFMANLPGHTPQDDARDYKRLVSEAPYQPDELKLYPCMLVGHTELEQLWEEGAWQPYTEDELIALLATNLAATPPYTRISRMVRDFSAGDIMAGCTKANLRQMVERDVATHGTPSSIREMRTREIACTNIELDTLSLEEIAYETSNTHEVFLQWVGPHNELAGFARLSIPHTAYVEAHAAQLPVAAHEAMIREVHVYGRVAQLDNQQPHQLHAQHTGLGRALVKRACELAHDAQCTHIRVISAVGTRPYYRSLGFSDEALYQVRELSDEKP